MDNEQQNKALRKTITTVEKVYIEGSRDLLLEEVTIVHKIFHSDQVILKSYTHQKGIK